MYALHAHAEHAHVDHACTSSAHFQLQHVALVSTTVYVAVILLCCLVLNR